MINEKDDYIIAEGSISTTNLETGETFITGEGGGKSGSGKGAVEADNTLRSAAVVRIVEVISEGPIGGLCGGARGILINSTPLQNQDGSYNFPRVAWDYRVGLPQQDYMPGFPSASSELSVAAPVLVATPVVRTTSNAGIDAVKVVVQLPEGLSLQNTKNGNLNGSTVQFRIDTKLTSAGNWIAYDTYTISGKTTSPYESQYRIQRPAGTGNWDIRVVRLTPDSTLSSLRNDLTWARMTEIIDVKLGFEDTALIGVGIDAESVGSTIPTRSYMIKGRIISVPANYDPETRVYSGIWNGTFKQAWTDNPAWILYDLLTHERYGMGEFITNSDIDKFSFYDAAVYNDQLVPDGQGGQEPRFTFSTLINTQEPASKILQLVAGAFNSTLLQINGKWTVMQDRPTSPTRNITNSSVIDGDFVYKSSGLFDRHTAFNVSWNDRTDRYLLSTSVIEDLPGIARYGYTPYDVAAYGATTEGQALRKGKWALDTELNQTEMVNFRMGMNGFDLINNDIVRIFDEDYAETVGEGRILRVEGNKLTLDRKVKVQAGAKITFTLADGFTHPTANIINGVEETNTILIDVVPAQPILEMSVFIVIDAIAPRQFKILNLTYPEEGVVEVEAVFHDPNKYNRVELGINVPAPIYSNTNRITDSVVVPPTDLIFVEQAVRNPDNTITRSLLVNWTPSKLGSIPTGYYIQYNRNEDATVYDITPVPAYVIPITGDGTYKIAITARDGAGRTAGTSLQGSYIVDAEALGALGGVLNLFVKGTSGLIWTTSDLNITWQGNPNNINLTQDYEVKVSTTGGVLLHTSIVIGTEFIYTLNQNRADNLRQGGNPQANLVITVTPRDFFTRKGAATIVTFTNPPPAAVTALSVFAGYQQASIQWTNQTESDVIGYMVWRGTALGFTPSSANLIADGLVNNVKDAPLPDSTTHYYKVAAYDVFSRNANGTGLNIASSSGNTTTSGANVNEFALTGSVFKPNDPLENKVSWTAGQVHQSLGTNRGTVWQISAGNATWTTGILYIYFVAGNTFLSSTSVLTDAIGDTKVIVATYRGGTKIESGNGNVFTDGSLILAGTVATAQLAAGAVLAKNIAVTQLQSISSDLGQMTGGSLTLDAEGFVRGGQVDYDQGIGFFQGYSQGAYKVSMGSGINYLRYNGANKLEMSCDLVAARGSFGGQLLAGVLNFSELEGIRYEYRSPGSYTFIVPNDKTTMRVTLVGGSGGGGGGRDAGDYAGGGGGGGAAGSSVVTYTGLVAGTSYTAVVGSKGLGGGVNANGTNGQNSQINGLIGVAAGLAGLTPGTDTGVGSGGAGGNGGGAGVNGEPRYTTGSGFTLVRHGGVGGSGGSVTAGTTGGNGGKGRGVSTPDAAAQPGSNGQDGYVLIEFFNPNSVVLQTTYNTLISALQRQGIQTV